MRVLLGTALYQSKHSAITGNIHTGFELGTEFLRNYVKSMRLHTCQGTEEQSPQTVLLLNITPFLPIMKKKYDIHRFQHENISYIYTTIVPVIFLQKNLNTPQSSRL